MNIEMNTNKIRLSIKKLEHLFLIDAVFLFLFLNKAVSKTFPTRLLRTEIDGLSALHPTVHY